MDLLCKVKKVCGIDKEYYHYRVVNGSISHTGKWDDLFMEKSIELWNKEKNFLEYCGLNEESQMMKNTAIERYMGCLYWICGKKCTLSIVEKYRMIKDIGNKIEIKKYKNKFDCTMYSSMKKIAKLLVKYNLEFGMILMGTLFFLLFEKDEN